MTKKEQHAKVCNEMGIDPSTVPIIMDVKDALKLLKQKIVIPQFKDVEQGLRNYFIADWSLIKITEAMNLQPDGEIWRPNYIKDNIEIKYEPSWFEIDADKNNPSGFGFSGSCSAYWTASATCGSRFAFKERSHLFFVMKQFEWLFIKKIIILKK